jgi:hypothetical protein
MEESDVSVRSVKVLDCESMEDKKAVANYAKFR